jgi:hypothetical protein
MDASLNGRLIPKGRKPEVTAYHDGKIKHDSTFTHVQTEDNAARAQHIDSGLYDNCFISTTRNEKMAVRFATSNFNEPGYVYVLDSLLFKQNKVKTKEFPDPLYPKEMEVSIREDNCGAIPKIVIVDKYKVDKDGYRKT